VRISPYGSWVSPITADLLVEKVVRLGQVHVDGDDVYWLEGRPAERGRQVVVRHGDGDAIPGDHNARTLVHEYGGGDYAVTAGRVAYANLADQRIYVDGQPLTDDDGSRFADFDVHPDGTHVACVRERHHGGEVVNDVVATPLAGGGLEVVAEGRDFFSAPRWAPDGRLAWLAWDHPNMPWDGTDLFVDGKQVAGGMDESISQPRWSPDGELHWVSDRTGWWNLYRDGEPLAPMDAEFTGPDWVFGQATYCFLSDGRLVAAWHAAGGDRLGVLEDGAFRTLETGLSAYGSVRPWRSGVVAVAASARREPAVVAIDVTSGSVDVVRPSRERTVDTGYISEPRPIEFPTEGGRTAHALYYPPRNEDFEAPPDERPPLIVRSHGGPTSSASAVLSLELQFWTSRGFAVVDVDYGGSTGYGRAYRRLLDGQWGVVDTEDCAAAARWLAEEGEVDPARLAIRGGSAGGYTTLCALTFRDDFAVGASYYGVADAEALAADTHKFEARYLDRLIGPYPEARSLYRERSPINFADRLRAPLILFQGLEDKVVPPSQAEVMIEGLRRNGVPHAYVPFEGEQHGFRQADSIKRAAEAELWFYGRVLGFTPADEIEPVEMVSDKGEEH
jgi:dipeptidyl aminopeptidase/acylaminoacyl peptidase